MSRQIGVLVLAALLGFAASGCTLLPSRAATTAVDKAEVHRAAAMSAACTATAAFQVFVLAPEAETQRALSVARQQIEQASQELTASRGAIEALPDSAGRKHYIDALEKTRDILGEFDIGFAIVEADAAAARGRELNVAAKKKMDARRSGAIELKKALILLTKATDLYNRYAGVEGLGLQWYAENASLWRRNTAASLDAQNSLEANDWSGYSASLEEANRIASQINQRSEPALKDQPLFKLLMVMEQKEYEADTVRKQALDELGVSPSSGWTHAQLYKYIQAAGKKP